MDDYVECLVPGNVAHPDADRAGDVVGRDDVDVPDAREEPQDVAHVSVLEVEVDSVPGVTDRLASSCRFKSCLAPIRRVDDGSAFPVRGGGARFVRAANGLSCEGPLIIARRRGPRMRNTKGPDELVTFDAHVALICARVVNLEHRVARALVGSRSDAANRAPVRRHVDKMRNPCRQLRSVQRETQSAGARGVERVCGHGGAGYDDAILDHRVSLHALEVDIRELDHLIGLRRRGVHAVTQRARMDTAVVRPVEKHVESRTFTLDAIGDAIACADNDPGRCVAATRKRLY